MYSTTMKTDLHIGVNKQTSTPTLPLTGVSWDSPPSLDSSYDAVLMEYCPLSISTEDSEPSSISCNV